MNDKQNQAEFIRLMTNSDQALRRYIRTLVFRDQDLEDVYQTTAVAMWEKFDEFDETRPFFPWACQFAYFEVLQHRRRISRSKMVFDESLIAMLEQEQREEEAIWPARRSALRTCLKELPEQDIGLLRRYYVKREKVVEIAEQFKRPVKHLYNKLDRIRHRLGRCIEKRTRAAGLS